MTRPYRTPEKIERAKNLRRKVYDDRAIFEEFGNTYKRPTSNALVFALYSTPTEEAD